jgi:hypothetical protein
MVYVRRPCLFLCVWTLQVLWLTLNVQAQDSGIADVKAFNIAADNVYGSPQPNPKALTLTLTLTLVLTPHPKP